MQEKDQDLLEAYYNKYRNSEDKNPNYLTSKELNRIVKPNSKDHDILFFAFKTGSLHFKFAAPQFAVSHRIPATIPPASADLTLTLVLGTKI